MDKNSYKMLNQKLDHLTDVMKNGGKGSGNFGHAGRPGEVGGSGEGKGPTDKIGKGLNEDFKDWYSKHYPDDYQLKKIKKGTFKTMLKKMAKGLDDLEIFGDVDSAIIDTGLKELERRTGLNYDEDIYPMWMRSTGHYEYGESEAYKKFAEKYL